MLTSETGEAPGILTLCVIAAYIYMSFYVRGLLRAYAERVSPDRHLNAFVAPSVIWTFLFGVFYLQTQINRMIDARLLDAKI
jgi:hypothetical protein